MTSREFAAKLDRRINRADLLPLATEAAEQLAVYYALLSRWNARINLTSLVLDDAPAATLDRLIVEPLAAARYVAESAIRWVDLGSGGGSPAIPLKVVRPLAILTMVEATTKKAVFLREVVRELRLGDAVVENCRIEDLAELTSLAGKVELVSARALRINRQLFNAVNTLLHPQGRLHLYSNRQPEVTAFMGFTVESVQPLVAGLDTRLVVLKPPEGVSRGNNSLD